MSVVTILQWMGTLLLGLLLAAVFLLLVVLLVPVRYRGQFSVEDPEPHEDAEWNRVLHSARGELTASWLGPFLRLRILWQDALDMDLQILFVHRDPAALLHRDTAETGGDDRPDKEPPRSPGERLRRTCRKADYYRRVLEKEETGYTLAKGRRILLRSLRRLLPCRWQLEGDIGFGDPAATAKVLEIQGMLIPLTAGHVHIRPQFLQYQMNGSGYCKGSIRLIHLVVPVLQLVTDRRVVQTIRRIRNADRNIERHYTQSAVNGG